MTREQYQQFESNVADFLAKNDVKPGCHSPAQAESEPSFSWRSCECCGSRLGGNRETYAFSTLGGNQFTADICTDCVYYLAYGCLDDLTMATMS